MINPNAITYTYNQQGYMLYYKDRPIGGAGTDNEKAHYSNRKLYKEQAELERQRLLNGLGRKDMLDAIKEIDSKPMIYVLTQTLGCSIGSKTFIGAYSTFEKAEEAKQNHKDHTWSGYQIHCIELDQMVDEVYMEW